jgi:hypothetical protein
VHACAAAVCSPVCKRTHAAADALASAHPHAPHYPHPLPTQENLTSANERAVEVQAQLSDAQFQVRDLSNKVGV